MPYSHTINVQRKVIIQRFEGPLSLANVCESTQKLWADPHYDPSFDGITDLSHSVVNGSVDDVRALGRFLSGKTQASTGRWAVVTNDPKITAFVMLFARLSPKPSLSVFSTWAAAAAFMQFDMPPQPRRVSSS